MPAEQDIDLLVQQHFFKDVLSGVLVEVGAARPDYLSISASFRRLGWKVIAIEPNPDFCEAHRKLGHDVLQYACSDADADEADFFVVDSRNADYLGGNVSYESFSSLGIAGKYAELQKTVETSTKKISVKVRRLDTILAEHEPDVEAIDVLAVDVEGWEMSVVAGLDFGRYRPKVVILENLFHDDDYRTKMSNNGYVLWKQLEPNDVFVREDLLPPKAKMGLLERIGSAMFGMGRAK